MVGLRRGWPVGAGALAAVVGAVLVFAVPIASGGSQAPILNGSLAPSVPSDTSVFDLPAGGVPWVMTAGKVQLQASGMLHVSVEGLVVPPPKGTMMNPLPAIAASVYCNGTSVATTAPVPFSPKGNAQISTMVSLPAFCPAPAVLLNPVKKVGGVLHVLPAYIAFDGTA